jgi:hypothetical protein
MIGLTGDEGGVIGAQKRQRTHEVARLGATRSGGWRHRLPGDAVRVD